MTAGIMAFFFLRRARDQCSPKIIMTLLTFSPNGINLIVYFESDHVCLISPSSWSIGKQVFFNLRFANLDSFSYGSQYMLFVQSYA